LVIEPLRRLLREEFPFQPVAEIRTMVEWVERSVTRPRFDMTLLGVFALIALTVAAVGVYGLIAYGVRRRRREIGVRMALGATSGEVSRMVIRQGFRVVAPGLMLGMAGALALTRLLSTELYGVEPNDPLTLTLAGALLLGTGLVACWGPARRATKVNPVETLHNE
jgi:ABC-type antimicrobial peptide transport system permease subunit